MRRPLVPAIAVVAAAAAVIVPVSAADAAPARAHWSGPTQSVNLQLTPRDTAGLANLAQNSRLLTRAQRAARLAQVNPGSARAQRVAQAMRALGFTVRSTTDYAVDVSGPAELVRSYFGSARGVRPDSDTARALPTLPAQVRGLVTVAAGGDETRPALRPYSIVKGHGLTPSLTPHTRSDGTLTVAEMRSLYGVRATTTAPGSGAPIVASLQFATEPTLQTDLNNFAAANGLGGHTVVNDVDASTCDAGDLTSDDQLEVALDQETLLAVAPQLRQNVYTTGNCSAALDAALERVTSAAATQPIVALTTSWGSCEEARYSGPGDPQKSADQNAVNALLGAGVSIFAATGDSGSFDCPDENGHALLADSVDVPAVIPGVMAVGGTTGTSSLAAWRSVVGDAQGNPVSVATGGGYSCGVFPRFGSQASVAGLSSYPADGFGCPAGHAYRELPDMSADAGDGVDVFSEGSSTRVDAVIGTSFAAPLAAGGFAQTLANLGNTHGLGNIAALVYRRGTGFRDVTTGDNFSYHAHAGFDATTGLGTPNWPRLLTNAAVVDVGRDGSGFLTVRSVEAPNYAAAVGTATTPLQINDPANWKIFTAPYNGDGAADLWAVHISGDPTVELFVLSAASGYRTFLQERNTGLGAVQTPSQWVATAGPYAGDRASDLYLLRVAGAIPTVEVHAFSQASSFHTTIAARTSNLPANQTGWSYLVGDAGGQGDLVGVAWGAGRARTEVHISSRASAYKSTSYAAATALGGLGGSLSPQFSLTDDNGDGAPDLGVTLRGSSSIEEHILAGSRFTSVQSAKVTGLTTSGTPAEDSLLVG